MTDLSHLDALLARLTRENGRLQEAERALACAKSATARKRADAEIEFRKREVASCGREIDAEYRFLGIEPVTLDDISDDDLLAELLA
jgi:hypothetical protein